ncbi:MAG TPA: hypothetical protein DCY14_03165 [Anaerolineae bacterium]|nr:hypothetical protein [Anaerolineae bacterium]HRJ55647.1 hypothetical protein [Anaerolineales bacterium]
MGANSHRRTDPWAIIGVVLALFGLIFGDNIYQQIKGYSVFQSPTPSAIANNTTATSTPQIELATHVFLSDTPVPKPVMPTSNIGLPEHPIKILFVPSVDANVIVSGGEVLATSLHELTGLNFEIVVPTSFEAALEEMCVSSDDTIGFIPSLDRFESQPCNVYVAFVGMRSGQVLSGETISFGVDFPVDFRVEIEDALISFAKSADWQNSVGSIDFYNWEGILPVN